MANFAHFHEKGEALYMAAENGHVELVQYLVEHGADVNYVRRWDYGTPVLGGAVRSGRVELVKWLVEHGADIGQVDTMIKELPDEFRNYEIIKYLVAHDEQCLNPLLWSVAHGGHLDLVKYLVGHGADVNYAASLANWNNSVFRAAVCSGNLETIQWLVPHGANLEDRWYFDRLLRDASRKGHLEIVKYLLQHGADVWFLDKAYYGHFEILQCLLEHTFVEMEICTSTSARAGLVFSYIRKCSVVFKLLVKKADDVDWLLCWCAQHGYVDMVRFLLTHCKVNMKTLKSATQLAIDHHNMNIVRCLQNLRIDNRFCEEDTLRWKVEHSKHAHHHCNKKYSRKWQKKKRNNKKRKSKRGKKSHDKRKMSMDKYWRDVEE